MSSLTIWKERVRNKANQITFGRILLTTVILAIYQQYPALAFICILCAVASDFADGRIARKNGVTEFGAASDRFADKYLFFAMIYVAWDCLQNSMVSNFLIIQPLKLLIIIEFSLVVLAIIGYFLKLRVQSKLIGKWKFGFECATMCFITLFTFTPYLKHFLYSWMILFLIQIFLLLTNVLAVFSLASYLWEYAGIAWTNLKQLYTRLRYGVAKV